MSSQTESEKLAPGALAVVQEFVNTANLDRGEDELDEFDALSTAAGQGDVVIAADVDAVDAPITPEQVASLHLDADGSGDFRGLTEKIDYLQSLWDRIAATPETMPVPDWHREILDERLKDLEADPGAGDSWDVVQERLRKKFDSSH